MDFHNLAQLRYSCRKYTPEKPNRELLERVLSTARIAPSAKNLQPWKFVVIDEPGMLSEIKTTYGREWIQSAPVVIAVCGDHNTAWHRDDGKDHTDVDVAIATDHLTLAAAANGLATCWICKFDAGQAGRILELPEGWEVVALIPTGFPADETDPTRHDRLRKPMDEVVSYNRF
jgi:nitroreductase